jgi:iron complex outermembrane receptor protein
MTRKTSLIAAAVAVALGGSPFVAAAQQAGTAANTLDTVIVTGTRVADRTVAESQSPIDIITPKCCSPPAPVNWPPRCRAPCPR